MRCRASAPDVAQVARQYEEEVEFLGMAGLDGTDAMRAFVGEFGLDFPQAVSEDGRLWARFGVFGQGQWLFVDDTGETELVPYELYADELREKLDELLAT